ncbi:MAG: hypothetical protein JEZ00_19625 [Anaerolineaceae bacterium]|nr:hypothetical protein [Anaerolineaceae bacterium]
MEIWYTTTEKFDPSWGTTWDKYIEWIKLSQLVEVISLCSFHHPDELYELIDEDWKYNIHQDYRISYFTDLNYLLKRFSGKQNRTNILAVCLEPEFDVRDSLSDSRFVFQGYDLVGKGDPSAITNCGDFDGAFRKSDVSSLGLFDSFDFAKDVQNHLNTIFPISEHTNTELWAIWKLISW